jgi:hypothetical protein
MTCVISIRWSSTTPVDLNAASQQVVDDAYPLLRNLHSHDERRRTRFKRDFLSRRQIQAVAVVAGPHPGFLLCPAQLVEALGGTVAAEGVALLEQLRSMLLINCPAFALPVGSMRPADVRPLVPAQPQPAQRAQDGRLGSTRGASLVGILNAQQKLPAGLLRETVVEQRHVGGADMRVAGRRGRHARAYSQGRAPFEITSD